MNYADPRREIDLAADEHLRIRRAIQASIERRAASLPRDDRSAIRTKGAVAASRELMARLPDDEPEVGGTGPRTLRLRIG